MTQRQLETLLRKAPRPKAPPGLIEKLREQIVLPPPPLHTAKERPPTGALRTFAASFWRRWLPAFSLLFFLACLVVIGIQTSEILRLRRANSNYRARFQNLELLRRDYLELQQLRLAQEQLQQNQRDSLELQNLQAEVSRLRTQLAELPNLRQEHEQLRNQLNSTARERTEQTRPNHPRSGVAVCADCHYPHRPRSEQVSEADEKDRQFSHTCAGFIKYISLVARAWASTNANAMPRDFLAISHDLKTPRILICPLDREKLKNSPELVPTTWEQWQPNMSAYEILAPGTDPNNGTMPYVRCRNHGHIGQVDGTVLLRGALETKTNLPLPPR